MEDAFIVLFFTFITQQLQHLANRTPRNSSHSHNGRTDTQDTGELSSPTNSLFPWLDVDTPLEEVRDFFPSEAVKSVMPNPNAPVHLKLSVILEAFQQFLRGLEALKQENQSLWRKGKVYDDLVKKYRALEAKMMEMQAKQNGLTTGATPTHVPGHQMAGQDPTTVHMQRNFVPTLGQNPTVPSATERQRVADLEEQAKRVAPLEQAYVRSEERCKQLVEVTQQWALECDSKVQVIQILEKETEQLKATISQLDARVGKYKKYWLETKDALPPSSSGGRGSDGTQFEELRSELAMRRELYDQVSLEGYHNITVEPLLYSGHNHIEDKFEEIKGKLSHIK